MLELMVALLLGGVPAFFLWAAIHEFSHLLMVQRLEGLVDWEVHLLPGMTEKGWRWSYIRWVSTRTATDKQQGWISLAPRIPDLIAAVAFPFAALIPNDWLMAFASVLVGGGLVDLANGSVGWSPHSDLQKASRAWGISPWLLRVLGFTAVVASSAAYLLTKVNAS